MHKTLSIKDLSASTELDHAAMSAVCGGVDNQANGTSQANGQSMIALANVGNASLFLGGPTTIQADATFKQDASNTSVSTNFDLSAFGWFGR